MESSGPMPDSRVPLTRRIVRKLIPRAVRNVLRSPGKSLEYARQKLTYAFGGRDLVQVRPGWEVRCHPVSRISFDSQVESEECVAELDGFIAECAAGMRLFDVGAHFGVFTLAACRYAGPTAKVWAFEPSAEALAILKVNVALAGATDAVTIVPEAIGTAEGTLPMLTVGAGGHFFVMHSDENRADATRLPATTFAGFTAKIGEAPTHVKIDVESFEYEIIAASRGFFAEHKPKLFLELHAMILRNRGLDPKAVLDTLKECGYTRVRHHHVDVGFDFKPDAEVYRLIITA